MYSAFCPIKLYICSKFHENIHDHFKVIELIRFLKLIISMGHYYAKKNVAGVTVFILYTSSDAVLYLYQVS